MTIAEAPVTEKFSPSSVGVERGPFTNRFEIKYRVPTRDLEGIEAGLRDHLTRDWEVNEGHGYQVTSIYFDSPSLRFFHEKQEGNIARIKPRVRWYANAVGEQPASYFLELKGRHDRIVLKRRTAISRDSLDRILADPQDISADALRTSSVLSEFAFLVHRFDLRPCVSITYHRVPYRGLYHDNLRMTFDRLLKCSLSTSPDSLQDDFNHFLPANRSIMELKYNERISALLLRRLNVLGLRQRTFSKYTQSMGRIMGHFRME